MRQVITLILLCLAIIPALFAAEYRFVKIDFPDAVSSEARGVNARGDIVGDYLDADDVTHAYLLRQGTFTSFDFPGRCLHGRKSYQRTRRHRWSLRGCEFCQPRILAARRPICPIDYPGASGTSAFGINNSGDITGSHSDAMGHENGFLLKDGVFRNVHVRGSLSTALYGAQDNGRVWVGQAQIPPDGAFRGFVRNRPGDFQLIAFPGFPCTVARWINQRGDIVGLFPDTDNVQECSEASTHGFLLQNDQYTQIDFPRSTSTRALAVNDDGVIVGLYEDRQGRTHGFKAISND